KKLEQGELMNKRSIFLLECIEVLCIVVFLLSIFILIPIPNLYHIDDVNPALGLTISFFRLVFIISSFNGAVYVNKLMKREFLVVKLLKGIFKNASSEKK
ncbi:MAG: hypothetical protein PHX86_08250, partial [Caldisericia bacterium]|nr:hypothetical protein [Caldisericia bacterium]